MAKIIELIITGERKGTGNLRKTRRVIQLWTKDGKQVVEYNPLIKRCCDVPTSMQGFNI